MNHNLKEITCSEDYYVTTIDRISAERERLRHILSMLLTTSHIAKPSESWFVDLQKAIGKVNDEIQKQDRETELLRRKFADSKGFLA